ncbi:hypothetical protein, partial [Xanthomonas oryzae]|uniref:hypothetical protein n=1 Tax=Xanthomonas oryzae TaxID=347 RepID=UPI0011808569
MELSADELKTFLFEHGDLHDCRITNVTWSLKLNRLEVSVADLNANFLGLPEYAGPQPGRLIFDGANSTLIRNAFEDLLGEDFEGRFESKYLART